MYVQLLSSLHRYRFFVARMLPGRRSLTAIHARQHATHKNITTMAPPTGLLLGRNPRKPTHRVGSLIGEGACSSVFELESIDGVSEEKFAIKIAPLSDKPPSKKRKPTPVERNANLLHHETLMYTAQLNKLRGTYIPYLPSSKGPPHSGDVDGTCLVI